MERASVLRCLEDGVEVAVLAGDRTPAVLFRYEKDVRSVVRCRIIATEQLRTEKGVGWNAGLRLAAKANGIRVLPLEPAPTVEDKVLPIGEQPPTADFTNATQERERTNERVVTTRQIVMTWAEFEPRLKEFDSQLTAKQAQQAARAAAREQAAAEANAAALALRNLGFEATVHPNAPGVVLLSHGSAHQIADQLTEAQTESRAEAEAA